MSERCASGLKAEPRLQAPREQPRLLGSTRAQGWGILFLVFTAIFLLIFGYRYLDDLSRERTGTFGLRLLEESTGAYTVFVMLPLVFRAARFYLQRKVATHWAAYRVRGGVLLPAYQHDGGEPLADRTAGWLGSV